MLKHKIKIRDGSGWVEEGRRQNVQDLLCHAWNLGPFFHEPWRDVEGL